MKRFLVNIFCILVLLTGAIQVRAQIYTTSSATVHSVGGGISSYRGGSSTFSSTSSRRLSPSTSATSVSIGASSISSSLSTAATSSTTTEAVSPADYQMASTSSASMSPSRYATAGASSSSTGVLETIASSIIPGTTTEDYTDYSPAQVQSRKIGWQPPTVAPLEDSWDVIVLLCLALGALAIYRKRKIKTNIQSND